MSSIFWLTSWTIDEPIRSPKPHLIVIIDGMDRMLAGAERALYRKLGHLLNHGPDNGFRLFISVDDPITKEMRPLLRYKFSLRLAGKAADPDRAWAASGMTGTGAEMLSGSGDFIAVRGENCHRFQVAAISDGELCRLSRQFEIQKGRVLLVHPSKTTGSQPGVSGLSRVNGTSVRIESLVHEGKPTVSDSLNYSGSDEWLTAGWIDRFWMDRN